MNKLILSLLYFVLSSCSIIQYQLIVVSPLQNFGPEGITGTRLKDISVGDTITTFTEKTAELENVMEVIHKFDRNWVIGVSSKTRTYKKQRLSKKSFKQQYSHYNLVSVLSPKYNSNRNDASYPSRSAAGTGRTIHTGPKGGRYYINSNGNKTYIKR